MSLALTVTKLRRCLPFQNCSGTATPVHNFLYQNEVRLLSLPLFWRKKLLSVIFHCVYVHLCYFCYQWTMQKLKVWAIDSNLNLYVIYRSSIKFLSLIFFQSCVKENVSIWLLAYVTFDGLYLKLEIYLEYYLFIIMQHKILYFPKITIRFSWNMHYKNIHLYFTWITVITTCQWLKYRQ